MTSMKFHPAGTIILAWIALAGCGAPTPREGENGTVASTPQPAPADAVLVDQLGGTWSVRGLLAGPSFLIVGGAAASERSTCWDLDIVGPLATRLGWSVHRVVCLSSYPRLFHGAVTARVRASARPRDAPILLDWDDLVARRLGCAVEETTIIALAPGGNELGRLQGEPDATAGSALERIVGTAAGEAARSGSP